MKIVTTFIIILASGFLFAEGDEEDELLPFERPYQGVAIVKKELQVDRSDTCSVILMNAWWSLTSSGCKIKVGDEIHYGTRKWCSGSGHAYKFDYDDGQITTRVTEVIKSGRKEAAYRHRPYLILAKMWPPFFVYPDNVKKAPIAWGRLPFKNFTYELTGWGYDSDACGSRCDMKEVFVETLFSEDCKKIWGPVVDLIYVSCSRYTEENPCLAGYKHVFVDML